MKTKILGLLVVGLLAGPLSATAAAVTYSLSFATATHTLTGTITTDGTLGSLSVANITGWSFMETGSPSFGSIDSTLSGAWINCDSLIPGSCGLSATASALEFDFNSNASSLQFRSTSVGNGRPALELGAMQYVPNGPIGLLGTGQADGNFVLYCNPCSSSVIATVPAPAPEPGTLALLGLGLAGLGLSRRRKTN